MIRPEEYEGMGSMVRWEQSSHRKTAAATC